jgi:hypothetical protein
MKMSYDIRTVRRALQDALDRARDRFDRVNESSGHAHWDHRDAATNDVRNAIEAIDAFERLATRAQGKG